MRKSWELEEIEFLTKNYPLYGGNFCATALNRTVKAIRRKAETLTIKAPGAKLKSHQQYEEELLLLEADAYPLEQYITNKVPILHECSNGHTWKVKPNHILSGRGCPVCANHGFNKDKPAILYYIKIEKDNLIYYKIGITNTSVSERFIRDKDKIITELKIIPFDSGEDARVLEQSILKAYPRVTVEGFLNSGGNTELFEYDILNIERSRNDDQGFHF